ncbi:MAG: ribosome silencing factor [Desulfovibrionaceae bacterium]|nr:ribosome silencing factor [Desulfovibrionaceae bacterium]MBF0515434.1 ribosome silencing factor [Desulfovibrionaceae bacterium]
METLDKVRTLAGWLAEKKAKDVVAIDVSRISNIAEVMLLATAGSARQAQALADHLMHCCGESKTPFLGHEGYKNAQWILIDLGDVMVHVLQEDSRRFYNLEGLWSEGPQLALPRETENSGDGR